MKISTLKSISPIDGRYRELTDKIGEYFSEYAYIKYRVLIEIEWLKTLLDDQRITSFDKNIECLNKIYHDFDIDEAQVVKEIEKETNHDVKAIEYYIRKKLNENSMHEYNNFVHFACTSEDINNLALTLMIKDCLKEVIIPKMEELLEVVESEANELKDVSMLSHTHGQAATPTTVGKELAVFAYRWKYILDKIKEIKLKGKFSGAVGNFSAHYIAYEDIDWIQKAREFVMSLGIEFNPLTTQIESHDTMCELFNYIKLFNNITLDFNNDMWIYISKGYFKQKIVSSEVGSSVMPHKVNPINHENSMANIHMANCIIDNFTNNLQISKMQRDLSDSSNMRNVGVMFSHTLVSLIQTIKGFSKMLVNKKVIDEELDENPEVLSEAIQTILRKNGYNNAYEILKELTRGKKITIKDIRDFTSTLDIDSNDKNRLLELTPEKYIGLSDKLVEFI